MTDEATINNFRCRRKCQKTLPNAGIFKRRNNIIIIANIQLNNTVYFVVVTILDYLG